MEPAEDIFAGPSQPLPVASVHRANESIPVEDVPLIRHVSGYGPFLTFCTTHQMPPRLLAADLARLVSFLRKHIQQVQRDSALAAAATVFSGNTLAALRPDAQWQAGPDGDPIVGTDDGHFQIPLLLEHLHIATEDQIQLFLDAVEDWVHWEPLPTLTPLSASAEGTGYRRPPLPHKSFRAPDGHLIPYGHLWDEDGPPEEAYSRITHPERFAGLHQVAQALVDHLTTNYEVTADEGLSHTEDLLRAPDNAIRATRLTPTREDAAPLTIVCTLDPGVIVHAGALCELPFPDCSCDACDETVEDQAEELEQFVLAVATGAFRERYPLGRQRIYEYAWAAPDGSSETSSHSDPPLDSPAQLENFERRLAGLPDGCWQPWSPRPRRNPR